MTTARASRHAFPLLIIVVVAGLDLLAGPQQVVLGLVGIAPIFAALSLGRRATLGYAVLALAVAALLGIYDNQYTGQNMAAQIVRLIGVATGGIVAVVACDRRLQREARIAAEERDRAADLQMRMLAESLQHSLLTEPPPLPRLEAVTRYVPASRHAKVGGDWYDAFCLPDGSIDAVIGDVAGHDGPAAAVMAHVRGVLRGIAQAQVLPPSALLTSLDGALRRLGPQRALVTIVMAQIVHRPADTLLCWSNAGHPPPLLIRADGRVELLFTEPELLIGVDPQARRSDHEVTLAGGEILVLYTDGLVERHGVDLDDGLGRMTAAARRSRASSLAQLCDELLAAVPGPALDDIALLAVRTRAT